MHNWLVNITFTNVFISYIRQTRNSVISAVIWLFMSSNSSSSRPFLQSQLEVLEFPTSGPSWCNEAWVHLAARSEWSVWRLLSSLQCWSTCPTTPPTESQAETYAEQWSLPHVTVSLLTLPKSSLYFRQVQEEMFWRADDGSLPADLTLGLLQKTAV